MHGLFCLILVLIIVNWYAADAWCGLYRYKSMWALQVTLGDARCCQGLKLVLFCLTCLVHASFITSARQITASVLPGGCNILSKYGIFSVSDSAGFLKDKFKFKISNSKFNIQKMVYYSVESCPNTH